jgi:hypothetical protein
MSILRDFGPAELRRPLPGNFVKELEWKEQMYKMSREKYAFLE